MLKKIEYKKMGKSNLGWLNSTFHFSFSEYYNPFSMQFGKLRVLNDDLIAPGTGFDMHPHQNMEIISYVVNGELTHADNIGNKGTVKRGNFQYMSAGTGIYHSEHNLGKDILRILQIWIYPDKAGYTPSYGDLELSWEERENKWLQVVSSKGGKAPIKINQDANIYVLSLDKGNRIDFPVTEGRQAYLIQIEGISTVNDLELTERDALEIVEEDINIYTKEKSHFMILEMRKA